MDHEFGLVLSSDGQGPELAHLSREFQPKPASARAARRFVTDVAAVEDLDVAFRLSAVISELANNAVIHARTPFTVSIAPTDDRIRVSVTDGSAIPPVPRTLGPHHPSGRGLHIVEALAEEWGYSLSERGKTVWFEIALPVI